MFVDIVNVFIL